MFHKLKTPIIIKVKKLLNGSRGFVLYPFVFITDPDNVVLMRHELAHVKQVEDLIKKHNSRIIGWIIFYTKWLYYTCRYGYWNNPYEIEARNVSYKNT